MRIRHKWIRPIAAVAVLALVAAACGGDDDSTSSKGSTATTAAAAVPDGGTLVIGAEQEPDCADWIGSCAAASWGFWMMTVQTMPAAYLPVKDGDVWTQQATSLLTGDAELTTDPKQTVTYSINPDAVWSDGEPITCDDFEYTWDQIVNGTDIYDTTGYTSIESVDCTDEAKPVVTFSESFASWRGLFGGGYGIMPSHILKGKDRAKEMTDGYTWSGGPWLIESWKKGDSITLVPNDAYWGQKPHLDKVIFKILPDTAAEFAAFKSGQVQAIYPQPQLDVVDAIKAGLTDAQTSANAETAYVEALWLNNDKAPFDSLAVRQAVAYAVDRDAIVAKLFGDLGVDKAVNSLNPYIVAAYSDQEAWSQYSLDLAKVEELMTGDGWEKNADGIWEKDGKTASFSIQTTAGNKRRELTEQVLQQQMKDAGFDMTIDNKEAGDLFGTILPAGDYQMSLYASGLTLAEPGLCVLFCSKNIPSQANDMSGQNWQHVNIPEVDPLLETIDTSLDDAERAQAGKDADKILADNQISLPLDPLPDIMVWSNSVVGPISDNPITGMFWNLNEWGLQQ